MAVKSLRQRSILRKLFCATGSFIVSQRLPDANTHIEDTVAALSALVAEGIEQSAKQIERLSNFTPVASERHDEGNMAVTDACRRDGAICYC